MPFSLGLLYFFGYSRFSSLRVNAISFEAVGGYMFLFARIHVSLKIEVGCYQVIRNIMPKLLESMLKVLSYFFVSSLPELLEKKRLIDMHMNIATAMLDHIKVCLLFNGFNLSKPRRSFFLFVVT